MPVSLWGNRFFFPFPFFPFPSYYYPPLFCCSPFRCLTDGRLLPTAAENIPMGMDRWWGEKGGVEEFPRFLDLNAPIGSGTNYVIALSLVQIWVDHIHNTKKDLP